MIQPTPSILKSTMTTGAFLGLALIVYAILIYFIDFSSMNYISMMLILMIRTVILIAGIVYGTRVFRDKFLNGIITYRSALVTGTLIVLFAGIIYSFYNYIFNSAIDPTYAERFAKMVTDKFALMMQNQGIPDDQIEKQVKLMNPKDAPGAFELAILEVFSAAFVGFIISLVTAAIIKKDKSKILNKKIESPEQL